jgi:hypothetical protein
MEDKQRISLVETRRSIWVVTTKRPGNRSATLSATTSARLRWSWTIKHK